jgi:hypothetical protein
MANQFTPIVAPAANGSGAAVDVSTYGATKTFTVADPAGAFVTIEMSNQLVATKWAPLTTFLTGGEKTINVAARWVRATVTNYQGGGAPIVNIGGDDSGASFATLVAPGNNGNGAGVDTSTLPEFKTVHVTGTFKGALQIEISEDGGATYVEACSFRGPGIQSFVATADFMRASRNGIVAPPGATPTVNIAATQAPGASGGGAVAVTSQQTAIVDPAQGNDATGAFGDLSLPYATIQGALDDVPTPAIGDGAASRTVWTIIVSPGTYDEDLDVDLTHGKKIILTSWGPWNLGTFDDPSWQPSGVLRSIAITTTDDVVNDFIHGSFAIQTMLPAATGDETQNAYSAVPRISGQIDLSGVFAGTPSIDLTLQCVVFGVANAAIVAGATDVVTHIYNSRMRGTVVGAALTMQDNEQSRFEDLLDVLAYGRFEQCAVLGGMTVVGISPSSNTIPGFIDCQLGGEFTGDPGSYWFDLVTSYWFDTNACTFAGGASRTLTENAAPSASPGTFGTAWHGDENLAVNFDQFSQKFYEDLNVQNGVTLGVSTGDAIGSAGGNLGFLLFVNGTLTIEAGGFIDVSGQPGALSVGGLGGGNGGDTGAHSGAAGTIGAGDDATNAAQTLFPSGSPKKGGDGGAGTGGAGGAGSVPSSWEDDDPSMSPPLALGLFGSPTSNVLGAIRGSGGGGGGGGDGALPGGGGGGGAGIRWIFARHIVAPAGSIRARGGAGAAGPTVDTGGGGGGLGGCLIIYTLDEDLDPAIFDVSGGVGGASGGGAGVAGEDGDDGRICIATPSGVTWIG